MAPGRDPLSTPLRELAVNKQHVLKDQLPSVLSQSNLFSKGKAEPSYLTTNTYTEKFLYVCFIYY